MAPYLIANADAIVEVTGATVQVRVNVVDGGEHDELWRQGLQALPSYGQYVGERTIPVVVLEPDRS